MASFTISTHVAAPPELVFAFASDFASAAQNIAGIERVEVLSPGPVGVGMRFRETRVMFGKESTEEMEVTAFDSPHGYVVECDSCGAHFCAAYSFVPDIWGTTVRVDFDCRPISLFARLLSPLSKLMLGPMKKCVEADLDDLKNASEAEARRRESAELHPLTDHGND